MQFLALLYADESALPFPGSEEFELDLVGFARFGEQAGPATLAGEAVEPYESIWGPHPAPPTESDMDLVGFYVLECDDLDTAMALARLIPVARYGAVEVRELAQWFDRRPLGSVPGRFVATLHHSSGYPTNPTASHADEAHAQFAALSDRVIVAGGPMQPPHTAHTIRRINGELVTVDGPAVPEHAPAGALYILGGQDEQVEELLTLIPLVPDAHAALRPLVDPDEA